MNKSFDVRKLLTDMQQSRERLMRIYDEEGGCYSPRLMEACRVFEVYNNEVIKLQTEGNNRILEKYITSLVCMDLLAARIRNSHTE